MDFISWSFATIKLRDTYHQIQLNQLEEKASKIAEWKGGRLSPSIR